MELSVELEYFDHFDNHMKSTEKGVFLYCFRHLSKDFCHRLYVPKYFTDYFTIYESKH